MSDESELEYLIDEIFLNLDCVKCDLCNCYLHDYDCYLKHINKENHLNNVKLSKETKIINNKK